MGGVEECEACALQPVTAAQMEMFSSHGPVLQTAMFAHGELPDVGEVERTADRARELFADRSDDHDELVRLETAMWVGATRGDPTWMHEHLSSTCTEVGRSGRTYDREAILTAPVTDPTEIDLPLRDVEVRALGSGSALVTYRTVEPRGDAHRLSLWRRIDGRWRLEHHHATTVPT